MLAEGPDVLKPIGRVESPLVDRDAAPKQGDEGSTATCWWCIRATTRRPRNGTPIVDVKPVLSPAFDR